MIYVISDTGMSGNEALSKVTPEDRLVIFYKAKNKVDMGAVASLEGKDFACIEIEDRDDALVNVALLCHEHDGETIQFLDASIPVPKRYEGCVKLPAAKTAKRTRKTKTVKAKEAVPAEEKPATATEKKSVKSKAVAKEESTTKEETPKPAVKRSQKKTPSDAKAVSGTPKTAFMTGFMNSPESADEEAAVLEKAKANGYMKAYELYKVLHMNASDIGYSFDTFMLMMHMAKQTNDPAITDSASWERMIEVSFGKKALSICKGKYEAAKKALT